MLASNFALPRKRLQAANVSIYLMGLVFKSCFVYARDSSTNLVLDVVALQATFSILFPSSVMSNQFRKHSENKAPLYPSV